VGFYEWMLALHVLAAFAVAASLVLYSILVYAGRRMTTVEDVRALFRVARIGGPLIGAGMGLALVLGIILAIDEYDLWDVWVIIGIVLWALMGFLGSRTGAYYVAIQESVEKGGASDADTVARLRAPTGQTWHLATVAVFVLIVLDMIFKPWA
jgi:hypothetical protein